MIKNNLVLRTLLNKSEFEDYFLNSIKSGFKDLTHLTVCVNRSDYKINDKFIENIGHYI